MQNYREIITKFAIQNRFFLEYQFRLSFILLCNILYYSRDTLTFTLDAYLIFNVALVPCHDCRVS